jgi:glycosyltransferase involved in cell wall biosynthesis
MAHGLRRRGASIYHYFFAPNPMSSLAGRLQRSLARVKTVQTVCSAPASFEGIDRHLFSDAVIVLSEDTRRRMIDAGVDERKVRLVRPCIEPVARPDADERRAIRAAHDLPAEGPLVVYPGDYEFSDAARTVAAAVPALAARFEDLTIVFACRIKRHPSVAIRDEIRAALEAGGLGGRVRFVDHVADMPRFVGAADVVAMPADSLYAKMDAPLVLLEAMAQGVPLVLADAPPLDELIATGAALPVTAGDAAGLAEQVGRLIEDPALGDEIGAAGARAVEEQFSPEKMASEVEKLYDEILK